MNATPQEPVEESRRFRLTEFGRKDGDEQMDQSSLTPFMLTMLVVAGVAWCNVPAQSADAQAQTTDMQTTQAAPTLEETTASTKELSARVKEPTTTKELLKNIKFVQEHALLLREDFYTDENVAQFFGMEKVGEGRTGRWHFNKQFEKSATLVFHFKDAHGNVQIAWSIKDANRKPSPDGNVSASWKFFITYNESGLRVKQVEDVFGSGGELRDGYGLGRWIHHRFRTPARDIMGNKLVLYDLHAPGTKLSHVSFRFDPDGIVHIIDVDAEGGK